MTNNFNLTEIKKVHFIGVGGIGMSGLARLFLNEGKKVSGSDRSPSEITKALQEEGVHIFSKQVKENISSEIDLVVYTEAMPHDHEELVTAREKGIKTVNYFTALGAVANEYYLVAVAGTHGKTTTTAMITDILETAEFDPTVIVGSLRCKTQTNFRAGKSKYMVVEACEYKRDFLSLTPDVLVITNLEHEHVDYYKDLSDVQDAFRELTSQVREGGAVIFNGGDQNVHLAIKHSDKKLVDYGKYMNPLLELKQPGLHNHTNAAAASAVAAFVGISPEITEQALENFAGTWRRFEYKGEMETGAVVFDDYSHHPTEIRAALQGAREKYPDKKITVVYQPHLASRTHKLFDDFVSALGEADRVLLVPIYVARGEDMSEVSSEKLSDAIGEKSEYCDDFESAVEILTQSTSEDDVIIVMGAGRVTDIATELTL